MKHELSDLARAAMRKPDEPVRISKPDVIEWSRLRCRHGCDHPVVGLYHAPDGCICFDDQIQALCAQHAVKGLQNNDMTLLLASAQSTPETK